MTVPQYTCKLQIEQTRSVRYAGEAKPWRIR